MTCNTVAPMLVDVARGVTPEPARAADLERHLRDCRACAERLAHERTMSAALRRLAEDVEDMPPPAESEPALLEAFDAAWTQPTLRTAGWTPWRACTAAGLAAATIAFAWIGVRRAAHVSAPIPATAPAVARASHADPPQVAAVGPRGGHPARAPRSRPRPRTNMPAPRPAVSEFVPWPGAADLPAFESGHLMRMEIPIAVVSSLGLVAQRGETDVVQADVLVGQDGFPRAIRLVNGSW